VLQLLALGLEDQGAPGRALRLGLPGVLDADLFLEVVEHLPSRLGPSNPAVGLLIGRVQYDLKAVELVKQNGPGLLEVDFLEELQLVLGLLRQPLVVVPLEVVRYLLILVGGEQFSALVEDRPVLQLLQVLAGVLVVLHQVECLRVRVRRLLVFFLVPLCRPRVALGDRLLDLLGLDSLLPLSIRLLSPCHLERLRHLALL